ncbi:MAG: PAS domain S-box protein [Candidatus Marinimicrobia bacterium]|nr:PAS domain S-box protein [Candidatus Neomarinimicrobiota bacterium]
MYNDLIFNTALILSLCTFYALINSIGKLNDKSRKIIMGLLFGGIICVSMMFPCNYVTGTYDAIIVILALSALCCGCITASITMFITVACRIITNGQGMWASLVATILTTCVGLLFNKIFKNRGKRIGIPELFLLGIIVSLIAIFSKIFIVPISTGWAIIKDTWFAFITIFPIAMVLGGLLFLHENQLIDSIREMKSSENKLYALTSAAMDAIIMLDSEGRVVFWNKSAEEMFGFSKEEICGKHLHNLITPDRLMGRFEAELTEFKQKGISPFLNKIHEMKALRKDGKEIDVELSISTVFLNNERHAIGIVRDITKRKKLENKIRDSEKKYRLIFENVPLGIVYFNKEGIINECNEKALKILGIGKDQLIGLNLLKSNREDVLKIVDNVLSGVTTISELEYIREGNLNNIYIRVFAKPLYSIENELLGGICIFEDISEIKKAEFEKEKLNRQLQERQRLESLGQLASGIAHDFNNILSIILGHASLLKIREYSPEDRKRKIEIIEKTAQRGAFIVKQLLDLAKKDDSELESVNINQLLDDIINVVNETFPKSIEVKFIPGENIPDTLSNESQLRRVFMNLCVNARDAMIDGGTLEICTSLIKSEEVIAQFPDAKKIDHIKIEFKDTGIGIKKEHLNNIFDPFFTTKEPSKGTGIGLSIVYKIVRDHNGYIEVQSEEGKGTKFTIYLPVLKKKIKKRKEVTDEFDKIPGGSETILIIEDEEGILEMMAATLNIKGYNVVKVADGTEAVKYFEENKEKIDLVITDMGIPGMGGDEVFYKLKEIKPYIKVIIVSGFIDPALKTKLFKKGLAGFIQKPYNLDELVRAVRNILDKE